MCFISLRELPLSSQQSDKLITNLTPLLLMVYYRLHLNTCLGGVMFLTAQQAKKVNPLLLSNVGIDDIMSIIYYDS